MTSSTYAPLEAQNGLSTGGPSDRYDDFVTESKHDTQANYSKISGRSSFSIPRKPLQSDDRPAQASPVPLSRPWYTTLMHTALDAFIFLAPLTFFTLAWCAYQLGGKEVSAWGISVQEWSLIAPTIFPIVFAAVIARSTHSMANFLLERGVSLITLEQLVRSSSISNALTTQIGLRTVTLLGVVLMLLWALSPAGGQASLRLLSITTRDSNSTIFVAYMNSGNQTSMLFDDLQTSFVYGQIDGVYVAALLGSPNIKSSPQDMWNNVKIPDMAYLNSSAADIDGWLPVPEKDVKYSSLLGYPVAGVPKSGFSSFLLNSYYYKIQCQKLWHIELNSTGAVDDWYTPLGLSSFNSESNVTTIFEPFAQSFATSETSFFISRYMANVSEDNTNTRFPSIFLGSQCGSQDYGTSCMSFANCTMEPVFVESKVSCTGIKCAVTKMRRAQPYSKTSFFWDSDLMTNDNTDYFDLFSQELPFAIPGLYYDNYQSTPTEVYLSGEESYPYSSLPQGGQVKLYESPIDEFSRRFTTVVNTYWLASMASGSFWTGSFWSAPMADITCVINNCSGTVVYGSGAGAIFPQNTTAQITHTVDIYACHVWWLAILVVSSTLLFGVGMVGVVLRWRTRGPDVLGYASSLVRDNPYVQANAYSSATDGLDYTRGLAGLKVRLMDVRPDDKYGHIAITSEPDVRGGGSDGLLTGRFYI